MIALGNEEFALGLRLAGIKHAYYVKTKADCEKVLGKIKESKLLIITEEILKIYPEVIDIENLVVFPEKLSGYQNMGDLNRIVSIAIGANIEI